MYTRASHSGIQLPLKATSGKVGHTLHEYYIHEYFNTSISNPTVVFVHVSTGTSVAWVHYVFGLHYRISLQFM